MNSNLTVIPGPMKLNPKASRLFLTTCRLGFVGCLALVVVLSSYPALAGELRAGVAKTDVTPAQPVTLSGYGGRTGLSQGIHEPLSARAVAFEQEGQRLVLLSLENVGDDDGMPEPLQQAILDACGLQPAELFLCATHTHSAPTLTLDATRGHFNNVAYTRALQTKLRDLVKAALSNSAPVALAAGTGSSPVGVNRREVVRDDTGAAKIVLGRNPSVLTDQEVQVLRLARPGSSDPGAVLFAYATHSTALGPKNYLVSGDIHGLAARFLEKYFGGSVIAPAFAGASGDIDPWFRVLPDFKTTNGWVPEAELMGTMLGEEVVHVLRNVRKSGTNGPVRAAFNILELPGKADDGNRAAAATASVPFRISVARVGDVAFVGLGGEVFNEAGKWIKSASPFPATFIITHCNGAAGYVPTRSSYPEGGYEVQSSRFAPGAAERLAAESLRLLRVLSMP